MRKAVKIGNIKLDNALFIKEDFDVKNVMGTSFKTVGGGLVVFESVKRNNANYYTLISQNNGWLRENTIRKIQQLADNIEVETTILLDNNQLINARFAYEKGEVIKAEPIFEGSEWFRVEIAMCEI